jgi:hypothetical protein
MTAKMGFGAAMALGLCALLTTDAAAQGGRGFGMMRGSNLAGLLGNEGVQKELKLDADQTSKASELATKTREKMGEAYASARDLEGDERLKKMQEISQEINAGVKKEASEFLKADQLTRLAQIDYQVRGASAFGDPEVQSKLKITDDQKSAIKEIQQESAEAMRSLFSNAGNGGNREEMRTKMAELQKSTQEKVEGKLTDDQKKSWKELIGAPFEVKFAPRQRRQNN